MLFNTRYRDLKGQHSILSASSHSWLGYDADKMQAVMAGRQAAIEGTKQHDFAAHCILMDQRLEDNGTTLSLYVNDCIGYRLKPEQMLYYSANAFGTADAIDYREADRILRIFDLKTGLENADPRQLIIYAAYFCLEYKYDPFDSKVFKQPGEEGEPGFDLRIYQGDRCEMIPVSPIDVKEVMEHIRMLNVVIDDARMEAR